MAEDVFVSDVVQVEHHLLVPHDTQATTYPNLPPGNGFAGAADGVLVIFTGIAHGPVSLTMHARQLPPPDLDEHDWDEVVELSMTAAADVRAEAAGLPALTSCGSGTYRVRVHARGRDTTPDATVTSSAEEYLIISWPQPHEFDVVRKQTDSHGAQLRSSRSVPGPEIRLDSDQRSRDDQLRRAGEQHRPRRQ